MSKILFFDTETTGLPRFRNQNALAGPDNGLILSPLPGVSLRMDSVNLPTTMLSDQMVGRLSQDL